MSKKVYNNAHKAKNFNYGDEETYKTHNKSKLAVFEFDEDGYVVSADYSKLDEYILNTFIPEHVESKINRNGKGSNVFEKGTSYQSVSLSKIVEQGFSELEIKHIKELFANLGIRICGKYVEPDENELNNFDYYNTYKNYNLPKVYPYDVFLSKFEEYKKEIDDLDKQTIRRDLVEHSLRLVSYVIYRERFVELFGVEHDELMSIGTLVLNKIIDDFDPSKSKFITYAYNLLKLEISRSMKEYFSLPTNYSTRVIKARRAADARHAGENIDNDLIADEVMENINTTGLTRPEIEAIKNYINCYYGASIEEGNVDIVSNVDSDITSIDTYQMKKLVKKVKRLLLALNPRELEVFKSYYVEGMSVLEISRKLWISSEKVRQLLDKAMYKIRVINSERNIIRDEDIDVSSEKEYSNSHVAIRTA